MSHFQLTVLLIWTVEVHVAYLKGWAMKNQDTGGTMLFGHNVGLGHSDYSLPVDITIYCSLKIATWATKLLNTIESQTTPQTGLLDNVSPTQRGTLKRLTFESMFINLKPTPLNLRPTSSQHLLKITKLKDLTLFTDQNQKIRADLQ